MKNYGTGSRSRTMTPHFSSGVYGPSPFRPLVRGFFFKRCSSTDAAVVFPPPFLWTEAGLSPWCGGVISVIIFLPPPVFGPSCVVCLYSVFPRDCPRSFLFHRSPCRFSFSSLHISYYHRRHHEQVCYPEIRSPSRYLGRCVLTPFANGEVPPFSILFLPPSTQRPSLFSFPPAMFFFFFFPISLVLNVFPWCENAPSAYLLIFFPVLSSYPELPIPFGL